MAKKFNIDESGTYDCKEKKKILKKFHSKSGNTVKVLLYST